MSAYVKLNKDAVEKILPMNIRQYVQGLGFVKNQNINSTKISVYENAQVELIIPQDLALADYSNRVVDLINKLSDFTSKRPDQIISELLIPPSDMLKFSIRAPSTETGTIALTEGISLLSSAKKAILSAACQAIDPQKYHRRLQRGDAESFLSSCRMGQTEFGSFVVSVSCPLNAGDQSNGTPLARRVTTGLIKSVQEIVSAINADNLNRISTPENNHIIASANLCDALLEMQPSDNSGELLISSLWSKQLAMTEALSSSVSIRKDYFPQIEQIAKALRPTVEFRPENIIARIDSLHGTPDANGRMYGDVGVVFLSEDEELIKARVSLSHEHYAIACDAHRDSQFVLTKGTLLRGSRSSKIIDYTSFSILPG